MILPFCQRGSTIWTERCPVKHAWLPKVLVGKEDLESYGGGNVKLTMVTAIECISADGRFLLSLIIWLAAPNE